MKYRAIFVLLLAFPTVASAHVGLHNGTAFSAGFLHPLSGMDHLLAMFCVGVLSTRVRDQAMCLLPALFVCLMVIGGLAGISGVVVPLADVMIALSVVGAGAVLVSGKSMPSLPILATTTLFAWFHGYAHGAEMSPNAEVIPFVFGFVLATTLLHLLGIGAGLFFRRLPHGEVLLRVSGAGVLASGACMLVS